MRILATMMASMLALATGQSYYPTGDYDPNGVIVLLKQKYETKRGTGISCPLINKLPVDNRGRHAIGLFKLKCKVTGCATPDFIARIMAECPEVDAASLDWYADSSLSILPDTKVTEVERKPMEAEVEAAPKLGRRLLQTTTTVLDDVRLTWPLTTSNATYAHNRNIMGDGQLICIIDSGYNVNHAELAHAIWTNPSELADGIDNDGNLIPDDINGARIRKRFGQMDGNIADDNGSKMLHGLKVAGVIVAAHNGKSVAGVAPKAKIIGCKPGMEGNFSTSDVLMCHDYCRSKGARIVTNSWTYACKWNATSQTGYGLGSEVAPMFRSLWTRLSDTLFVYAAGNNAVDVSNPSNPCGYPGRINAPLGNKINVGAHSIRMFGNPGRNLYNYGATVDIDAPGYEVRVLWDPAVPTFNATHGTWDAMGVETVINSGTSLAAPFVAGAAALLQQAVPNLTPSQIRDALVATCKPNLNQTILYSTCKGILQISEALKAVGVQ